MSEKSKNSINPEGQASIPSVDSLEEGFILELEQAIADFELTSSILGKLKMSGDVPIHDIAVSTKNGCVTLSGNFNWHYQKGIVNGLIVNMDGVKDIKNLISVNSCLSSNRLSSTFSAN